LRFRIYCVVHPKKKKKKKKKEIFFSAKSLCDD
jgi:hypothetical protein